MLYTGDNPDLVIAKEGEEIRLIHNESQARSEAQKYDDESGEISLAGWTDLHYSMQESLVDSDKNLISKIITIMPKFILVNKTSLSFEIIQSENPNQSFELRPTE
jgi:hypothetical protein